MASCDDVARPWLLQEQQQHLGLAHTHGILGSLYALQGKDETNYAYHKVCNVYRQFNNTAVYVDPAKNVLALEHYEKCRAIRIKALGEDHLSVAGTHCSMGGVYENQGDYKMALELHEKCLAIEIKALCEDHLSVVDTRINIAIVYKNQGREDEAMELYKKCLAAKIKALGADHLGVADIKFNIANLLAWRQVELAEAGVLLRESAVIYSKVLGAKSPTTINAVMFAGICEQGAALLQAGGRVGALTAGAALFVSRKYRGA